MSEREISIRRAVEDYFAALQGFDAASLTATIFLPFTVCSSDGPRALLTDTDLIAWWQGMVSRVRSESGMARAEILKLAAERLNAASALVRMTSARFGADGTLISKHRTGFIVYETSNGWRISVVLTELATVEPGTERP